jgi:hypothetical protein
METVMKRLGFLLMILPLFAAAEVVVPIDSVEENVNIRLSPDAKSEIVGRLNQGESANIVATIEGWHEVEIAGGATGFISADWTKVLEEAPEVAVVENVVVVVQEAAAAEATEIAEEVAIEAAKEVAEIVADVAADEKPTVVEASEETVEEVIAEDAIVGDVAEVASAVASTESVVETDGPKILARGIAPAGIVGPPGPQGAEGPQGPEGPAGPGGTSRIEGSVDYLMKFTAPTIGGNSQIFDDGNNIGIGTTDPKQRLEVNGNIQIHEQNSSVAGLMITQSDGETGYFMHNRASTLTIGAGSVDRITIDRDGNVGFGVARPSNPIELANGAHVTAGGVWTNSSSRERKENISTLSAADAVQTLERLEPVRFNYKNDQTEDYVGFIAEDVPEIVATSDRDGISAMDVVAVLTKVVQEQQRKIAELEARLDQR